jgi:hypothetical protein
MPVPSASAANRRGRSNERQLVDAAQREVREHADAVLEIAEGGDEGGFLHDVRSFDRRRILDAPMSGHRLTWPHRAAFSRGAVADGEHEVHHRGVGRGELLPAFRTHAIGRVVQAFEHLEGEGIDLPLGLAAGRVGTEPALAVLAHNRFRQDRPGAVTGAEEKDVVDAFGHRQTSINSICPDLSKCFLVVNEI